MTALRGTGVRERVAALADGLAVSERALWGVLAFAAVGLAARLAWLGARPMHFDEARVAFRVLESLNTGVWTYQWEIHGPLLQHVDRRLFGWFGPSDFLARLPVALVGGLLPLSALLFRDRLRDLEVVALAGLLSLNTLLLYYSRFMRSDVLVAAFSLVALGVLVRLYETGDPAYLYAAALALALAFASKENAVVYVLSWGGMLGLVAGLEVLQPRRHSDRGALVERARATVEHLAGTPRPVALRYAGHGLLALGLFAAVVVLMYAPRRPPGSGVGLGHSALPAVVGATVQSLADGLGTWIEGPFEKSCGGYSEENGQFVGLYFCNLGRELTVLARSAFPVALLALVGLVAEFERDDPRVLVPAAFYWGVASVLGYAWGTDIAFPPWVAVHAVVPLTIPAATGAAVGGRTLLEEVAGGDGRVAATLGVTALVLAAGFVGPTVHHSYVSPERPVTTEGPSDAYVAQYAQPDGSFREAVDAIRAARGGGGTDVLVYGGSRLVAADASTTDPAMPGCVARWEVLPLFWYLYSAGADVDCARNGSALASGLDGEPPVVIARPDGADEVRERVPGTYVSRRYELYRGANRVVLFFDATQVTPPPATGEGRAPERR